MAQSELLSTKVKIKRVAFFIIFFSALILFLNTNNIHFRNNVKSKESHSKISNTPWPKLNKKSTEYLFDQKVKSMRKTSSVANIKVLETSPTVIVNFHDKQNLLDERSLKEVATYFSKLTAIIYKDSLLSKSINNIKIIGFGNIEKKNNSLLYDYKIGLEVAKKVFQYIFNVKNLTFKYQSKSLTKAKTSGNGLKFLARESTPKEIKDYLAYYCTKNNCNSINKVMFRFYFN